MGEIKSVKVDNWGVFFLQKLQNFFNKTDYCDLTLQFNDNSQLKVHRLVLNACTDYFNILEQTCEMIEDILIMPPGLQADVVVPIVNFMYTGTLEFELKMYGRLLKTAKDMNMTVLLKLLEAHRRTMEGNKTQTLNKITPKALRRIPYNPKGRIAEDRTHTSQSTSTTPQRRSQLPHNTPQYKTLQIKPVTQSLFPRRLPESAQLLSKYPHTKTPVKGPSRFDCNEDALPPETFEKSFDNISYESKPLICKEEPDTYDYDNLIRKHETYASPFEQLRRGYTNINNNKRPSSSVSSYESPPEKKPNIQDVKEYSEQQRVRKQIAEEFGDDQEYDEVLDDEFHNDDDDDDYVPPQSVRRQVKQQQQQHSKVLQNQKIAKQDGGPRPTIVVRDSTTTNVNHAKIISEVLRKYPHLVKNNKNIKLKIMPQSSNTQKIVIKKENTEVSESSLETKEPTVTSPELKRTTLPSIPTPTVQAVAPSVLTPPRRIDSKTMHALIALGAENKEGPWLCLKCGVNGRPISIPSYRGFRRHLINTHKQKIDSRLCEHCGWRSSNNKDLAYHLLVTHSVKSPLTYNFPKCQLCTEILIDNKDMKLHMSEKHAIKKEKQTCVYCNRSFTDSLHIYTHMKAFHRERSIEDGIFDFSEDEEPFDEETERLLPGQTISDSKIKIISDISLPKNLPIIQKEGVAATATTLGLDANTELEVTVPTTTNLRIIGNTTSADSDLLTTEYIGTDSSQGPKFVNADGNEMELTPAQREEIISQLDQQHDGIVMVLNEEPYENASVVKDNTVAAATTSEQVSENSMFIVCDQETEAVSEQSMQSSLDKAKSKSKDKDPLEWGVEETSHQSNTADKEKKTNEPGNEVCDEKSDVGEESDEKSLDAVADSMSKEMEDKDKSSITQEMSKANKSPHDSLEMKLKLLTDWTDDEDEEELEEKPNTIEKNNLDLGRSNGEKNNSKEEILFETIAEVVDPDMRKDDNGKEKSEVETSKDETEKDKPTKEEHFENDEKERDHSELDNNRQTEVEEYREKSEEKDKVKGDSEKNIKTETQESKEVEACREITDKSVEPVDCEDTVETSTEDVKKEITSNLITKAELRNIMSDWVDDDEDEDEEL